MSVHAPPAVTFDAAPLRRRILAAYWLVFLLGIPLWWVTTSIERLALPAPSALEELTFPVYVVLEQRELAAQLSAAVQMEKRVHPVAWQGLDVAIESTHEHQAQDPESTYHVQLHPTSDTEERELPMWVADRTLHVRTPRGPFAADLVQMIASALSGLLAPHTSHARLAARYAPTFRLAFSLLNEDASAGLAVLSWDVRGAIERFVAPTLAQLRALHNFTVESQVQFHAPLAFAPPCGGGETGGCVLGEEELKMFVNSAEWTLASSVREDPVLHFILFVPAPAHRPLRIAASQGSGAFVVPQWGGVVVLGSGTEAGDLGLPALADAFWTFRGQLLALLGLAPLPQGVGAGAGQLSAWQLDALLRARARENARAATATLASIAELVARLKRMPVGQDVRGAVQGAGDALAGLGGQARGAARALQLAARAHGEAARAFFSPGMLALLYSPAEHRYALYVPLFAPGIVPLVAAAVREGRRWRAGRREKTE